MRERSRSPRRCNRLGHGDWLRSADPTHPRPRGSPRGLVFRYTHTNSTGFSSGAYGGEENRVVALRSMKELAHPTSPVRERSIPNLSKNSVRGVQMQRSSNSNLPGWNPATLRSGPIKLPRLAWAPSPKTVRKRGHHFRRGLSPLTVELSGTNSARRLPSDRVPREDRVVDRSVGIVRSKDRADPRPRCCRQGPARAVQRVGSPRGDPERPSEIRPRREDDLVGGVVVRLPGYVWRRVGARVRLPILRRGHARRSGRRKLQGPHFRHQDCAGRGLGFHQQWIVPVLFPVLGSRAIAPGTACSSGPDPEISVRLLGCADGRRRRPVDPEHLREAGGPSEPKSRRIRMDETGAIGLQKTKRRLAGIPSPVGIKVELIGVGVFRAVVEDISTASPSPSDWLGFTV